MTSYSSALVHAFTHRWLVQSYQGYINFKSLSAAENLVSKVRTGQANSALIVGAGFIGMEIALLLRELGVKVTQIEMLDQVMATMLDAETASMALTLMRSHGVDVRLKTKADCFRRKWYGEWCQA